jgi:hypothetical protein
MQATSLKPSIKIYRPLREPIPTRLDLEDAYYYYKQLGHFAKDYPKLLKLRIKV